MFGVVLDQRLVNWPQDGGKVGERLKTFLMKHPVAREILVDAEFDENDVHWRKNLAYLGVASRPFKSGENALLVPPFSSMRVGPIFRFMRTYNRRFAEIARRRRKRRALGTTNRARRCLIPGFKLHSGNAKLFLQGFAKMGEDRSWRVALVPNTRFLARPVAGGLLRRRYCRSVATGAKFGGCRCPSVFPSFKARRHKCASPQVL